ncbi:hypothetical protein OH77DRAFT_1420833 [Trametes cingulata]|nr:hypothetical protein OH77DRAFT_1420833 [Trametes cingulata]
MHMWPRAANKAPAGSRSAAGPQQHKPTTTLTAADYSRPSSLTQEVHVFMLLILTPRSASPFVSRCSPPGCCGACEYDGREQRPRTVRFSGIRAVCGSCNRARCYLLLPQYTLSTRSRTCSRARCRHAIQRIQSMPEHARELCLPSHGRTYVHGVEKRLREHPATSSDCCNRAVRSGRRELCTRTGRSWPAFSAKQ